MHVFSQALVLALAASAYAESISSLPTEAELFKRQTTTSTTGISTCPRVWTEISTELTGLFLSNGECNDNARAAIRAGFHDCFAGVGCDGSLILAGEFNRDENNGLEAISPLLKGIAERKRVGIADILQFAAAHAVVTCPLGPRIKTFVGRRDSSTPSPEGTLPEVTDSPQSIIALFASKGFNKNELAALMGAHSTSRQRFVDPARAGAAQDTTPGKWDVNFYGETLAGTAPFSFESDVRLANDPEFRRDFQSFVGEQRRWGDAFAAAYTKMSVLGVPQGDRNPDLIDCTSALPRQTTASTRLVRRMMERGSRL